MEPNDSLVVGIDGGGTACRAALVRASDGRRFELRGGPANVSDFSGAMSRIRDLVVRLATEAGLDEPALRGAAAHLGLAGVMDPAMAERIAEELPFGCVSVTDDQPTTIAGALGLGDGTVAAIGTGSFVGRQAAGEIQVLGGWGFALGDQASGAWLGRRLVTEALLAGDGIVPGSAFATDTLDRLGGGAGAVSFALAARPADYAEFAPDIVAAAGDGDATATRLMREGADYIEAAMVALGAADGAPLCLTGGLGPAYRDWLRPERVAGLVAPKGSALDGALALAARTAGEAAA